MATTSTWHLRLTQAPAVYDGFETATIAWISHPPVHVRLVAIIGRALIWQTNRYRSGTYAVVSPIERDIFRVIFPDLPMAVCEVIGELEASLQIPDTTSPEKYLADLTAAIDAAQKEAAD
jgi:hypothetical protein